MPEKFEVKTFPNGLTLLGLTLPDVKSAAFSFVLRSGTAYDPQNQEGSAAILNEWLMRGAGGKNSKQLNEALDSLGCQHSIGASSLFMQFSSAQFGKNLPQALALVADIFRNPNLDDETFEPCKQLIQQDLHSLVDEPSRTCTINLREKFFPSPLGRCKLGTEKSLANITADSLRTHAKSQFSPAGAMLGIAGNFDWDQICATVEELFGDWTGADISDPQTTPANPGQFPIIKETAQTHIGLMHKAVPARSELYYPARIAEAVLSRGMGSRLFTEVREKKGLCYGISCQYTNIADHAGMLTYAGTRPELAQQTLDVTIAELTKLAEGITPEELDRAKTQIRSMLVMQGQSTAARAGALVNDWYLLKRLRPMDELSAAIKSVTAQNVADYLAQYPAENFTLVTVGPEKLTLA